MSSARLMEHIWRTIEDVKYAELNGDTGNRAGLPWYESSHDHFMQDLCNWVGVLSDEVAMTPIWCASDVAENDCVRFWMLMPADDMTWDEVDEEPGILLPEGGCKKVYIDVYPRFDGYDVQVRRDSRRAGVYDSDEYLQEIADRVFEALHAHFDENGTCVDEV